MKKILFVMSVYVSLQSCVNNNEKQVVKTGDDSVIVATHSLKNDSSVLTEKVKSQELNSNISSKILGAWALVGSENATFVIEKQKIVYPETFTSYKYYLSKDSIKIKYDDYIGSYLIKIKGSDTLILSGDEEQVYFRFQK